MMSAMRPKMLARARSMLRHLPGGAHDAEDVVQEAAIYFLAEDRRMSEPLLILKVSHLCLDLIRKVGKRSDISFDTLRSIVDQGEGAAREAAFHDAKHVGNIHSQPSFESTRIAFETFTDLETAVASLFILAVPMKRFPAILGINRKVLRATIASLKEKLGGADPVAQQRPHEDEPRSWDSVDRITKSSISEVSIECRPGAT